MAAPTWVAAGTLDASTASITPGLPSGWAQGDIFLLFVENWPGTSGSPESAPSAPAGWTSVGTAASSGASGNATNTRLSVFWRRATASESAPTVSDPGDHVLGVICAFRGVRGLDASPFDGTATSFDDTADTAISYPTVTTSVDDCLIVCAAGIGWDALSGIFVDDLDNAALTGKTLRFSQGSNLGNGGQIGVYTGAKATAGVVGASVGTIGGSSEHAMWTIALAPANIAVPSYSVAVTSNAPSKSISARAQGIG